MSADSIAPLGLLRSIVLGFFPWLADVKRASDKGLSFKTDVSRLHLEGDAGDPAIARVHDLVVRLYLLAPTNGSAARLYASGSISAPYTWTAVTTSAILPPDPTEPGTPIRIVEGSAKVTCG